MASSREDSFDRHNLRARGIGGHRRHRYGTHGSNESRHETSEDALNDFYGGTANIDDPESFGYSHRKSYRISEARTSKPWRRTRPPQSPNATMGLSFSADIGEEIQIEPTEDDHYLPGPPDGDWERGEWIYAATKVVSQRDPFPERTVLSLAPTLVVTRRGNRFKSNPFFYEKGWTDKQFAEELKYQYANLKLRDVGLLQKLVAYKQIAYVIVLQKRFLKNQRKWMIVKSIPITNKGDKEGRDAFMYRLRYPQDDYYTWTTTVDNLIKPGAILYFEIMETFDSTKVNLGIFSMAVLSLGVALAYGFAMDRDFSTGFSISSWMVTAVGFFAALVSISEYAGQESLAFVQVGEGAEEDADSLRDE